VTVPEVAKTVTGLVTALLPVLEKYFALLPFNTRVREDLLGASVLLAGAFALGGAASAKNLNRLTALVVALVALVLALAVLSGWFVLADVMVYWERPVYLAFFSLLGFSVSCLIFLIV
jgi:hypothetical protein